MKKASRSNVKKRRKREKEPVSKYEAFKQPSKTWFGFLLRNIAVVLLFFFVLQGIYNFTESYKWLYKRFFDENYNFIKTHPNFTIDQRQQTKLGYFAKYLQFVKKHTPDSAIILMPPDSIIKGVDKKYKMKWLSSKRHTTYFLYPRKPVYMKNSEDSVYLKNITHVAIVNGYGYRYLPFKMKNKSKFAVIPVDINKLK